MACADELIEPEQKTSHVRFHQEETTGGGGHQGYRMAMPKIREALARYAQVRTTAGY
jgi:hypothetical protein